MLLLSSHGDLEVERLLHKLHDSASVDQSPNGPMDPLCCVRPGCVLYVCKLKGYIIALPEDDHEFEL